MKKSDKRAAIIQAAMDLIAKNGFHRSPIAMIAEKAKVRLLVLTHISARYGDTNEILSQARQIFPRVQVAEDLMKIEIPLREV